MLKVDEIYPTVTAIASDIFFLAGHKVVESLL